MKTIFKTTAIFTVLIALSLNCAMTEIDRETFRSNKDTSVIKNIKVINTSGNIEISEWDNNYIEYTVIKRAAFQSDADNIEIAVNEGNTFTLETIYPSYFTNVSVDYEIKIPKTLSVLTDCTSGDITVDGGYNAKDIYTTSGNIDIKNVAFIQNAESTSGNINIDINDLTSDSFIETTSGNITAYIKSGIYKIIRSSVTSGKISYNGTPDSGTGKYNINFKTTSGNINIYGK